MRQRIARRAGSGNFSSGAALLRWCVGFQLPRRSGSSLQDRLAQFDCEASTPVFSIGQNRAFVFFIRSGTPLSHPVFYNLQLSSRAIASAH